MAHAQELHCAHAMEWHCAACWQQGVLLILLWVAPAVPTLVGFLFFTGRFSLWKDESDGKLQENLVCSGIVGCVLSRQSTNLGRYGRYSLLGSAQSLAC